MDRVTSVTDGTGATTLFRYDAAGNLIETEDPSGVIVTRTYDALDRLISIADPISGATTMQRDADGNIVSVTDALGAVSTFVYDAEGQLLSSTDARSSTTQYGYDSTGNLVSLQNTRGAVTTFQYDPLGRRSATIDALGHTTSYSYDSRDNLVQIIDGKGQTLTSIYDQLNRLTQMTSPDNVLTFAYDDAGNIITANDNDATLGLAYDAANRLVTTTTGGAASVAAVLTNAYNGRGLRSSLSDSFGGAQAYAYDGADRLSALTTASSNVIQLTYDPTGRPTGAQFPNGTAVQIGYDAASGKLASIAHVAGGTDLARFTYGFNAVGNIASIGESGQIGAASRNYTYDELQRLIAGGTTAAPETYSYDGVGNRTISHLSSLHVVNDQNQLLDDEQFTYVYDANGNLTSKTAKSNGSTTAFTWDAQNQLIRIDRPDGAIITYSYDAFGRRVRKGIDGTLTRYVYDGDNIYLETDAAGAVLARYAHGDQTDQPLSFNRGGADYYFHTDHLGSVRQVTDAAGAIVNSYEYDSYGRFLARVETVAQPYAYTAREQDEESEFYYYRARYYDPGSGRFISEDPLGLGGGDINFYRYLSNGPVNGTDPTGKIGIGGAAFGAGLDLALQVGSCVANGQGLGQALSNVDWGSVVLSGSSAEEFRTVRRGARFV